MLWRPKWKPYDPRWLVDLAEAQLPGEPWLPSSLAECTRVHRLSTSAQIYFVDPRRPNRPRSDWQFVTNLELESPDKGPLVLDILTNERAGGLEFLCLAV